VAQTYKIITFDVFSALLDIQTSLTGIVQQTLGLKKADAAAFARTWRAQQMTRAAASNSIGKGRTSFKNCTRMGLDYTLAKSGMTADARTKKMLVTNWGTLKPWPEAPKVMKAIKAKGYATAILSNGDQDQLDSVAGVFGPGMFDHVLSSETAGFYKPHPSVYELPTRMLGIGCKDVLHVAGGAGDVLGAAAYGMACYWSNRMDDIPLDPDLGPTWQGKDLSGVLKLI
jgi:2-haloacid dehalogenase